MPKITYLKEFEGALWARLELDLASKDMPVSIWTESELADLRKKERQACWRELQEVACVVED